MQTESLSINTTTEAPPPPTVGDTGGDSGGGSVAVRITPVSSEVADGGCSSSSSVNAATHDIASSSHGYTCTTSSGTGSSLATNSDDLIATLPLRTEREEAADRVEAELDEMSRWVGPVAKSLFPPVPAGSMVDANSFADALGVSPLYKQKESQRWSSALNVYRQMSSSSQDQNYPLKKRLSEDDEVVELCYQSPVLSEPGCAPAAEFAGDHIVPVSGSRPPAPPPRDVLAAPIAVQAGKRQQNIKKGFMTPPGVTARSAAYIVSPPGRKSSTVSPGEASLNSLELEAIAAVHELQFAVKDIYVSEMLPRTSELIFLNMTTLEGQAYCVELTMKGWRVTSLRHDCMNGDINHLDLHIQYFETIYALMDRISAGYRRRFTDALVSKLSAIEAERGDSDEDETTTTMPCNAAGATTMNGGCISVDDDPEARLEQEMRQTFT